MPTNIVTASSAMDTSVDAAFDDSGGRNAGTPLDTASTPVIAVQPFENAVSSISTLSFDSWLGGIGGTPEIGVIVPEKKRQPPMPTSTSMLTMKKYVGTEKMRPDSR